MMRISASYFVLLYLLGSSLCKPDLEQSLANFRKALGNKLLAVDVVPVKPPAILISSPAQPVHTNLGIVQSYLGTETNKETAEAIQGVNNLISSGILSPLSEVNLNHSGAKKPCHHKEDVNINDESVLRPFSDSNNNNSPLPETAKPCHHKETSTQKPVSQTETPLQTNKDSNSDAPSASLKPCQHNSVHTITSSASLNSNSDKIEIPLLPSIPAAPQLPSSWQVPVTGQVVVEETAYIPDNQVVTSSQTFVSNNDKIEFVSQPVSSQIPEAPQLPPFWQVPVSSQVVVEESEYILNNQGGILQHIHGAIPAAPPLPPLWHIPVAGPIIVGGNQAVVQSLPSLISSSHHDCNQHKIEIVERPVLGPVPEAPQLPPLWQGSVAGQVVVGETEYIPDNQVGIVQHVQSTIPAVPQLPPLWQGSVGGQVVVGETEYIPDNQVGIVQLVQSTIPTAPQLPSQWQGSVAGQVVVGETEYIPDNQVGIVQHVQSTIPAAPQLPSQWQGSVAGQVVVGETEYIPDNQVAIVTNVQSTIPAAPQLPPLWQGSVAGQVVVEETEYIPDNQVGIVQHVQSTIPAAPQLPSQWQGSVAGQVVVGETEQVGIVTNVQSIIPAAPQLPPLWQGSVAGQVVVGETEYIPSFIPTAPQLPPLWQVPDSGQVVVEENTHQHKLPCPHKTHVNNKKCVTKGKVPAKFSFPEPIIETIVEPRPAPLVVDVPSTYTYQQVKGDGSLQTTFATRDGVHTRYVPNSYPDINRFGGHPQRPAHNLVTNNIKSYYDSLYPTVQSQYNQYPHIEQGFSDFTVHSLPYDYNQYPVQHHIPQRPVNLHTTSYNYVPRPQANPNYQTRPHVHPQSFDHSHQQQPNNFVQSSYGGYSYKQLHGDGSVTSYHGSDGNVQTLKSGSPQQTVTKDKVKKNAPQVPFSNNVQRLKQSSNVSSSQSIVNIPPEYNPMIAQEGEKPMFFSYMFKQLGFDGAPVNLDPNNKVMSTPTELPVVTTNVIRHTSSVPPAVNRVSKNPTNVNNVHVTNYSGFTNSDNKLSESSNESKVSATTVRSIDKGLSEINQSGPGFRVAYGIGGNKDSKKPSSLEYNPIIVLETTTSGSNYYYSQSNGEGFKTEYIGDKEKVVVQSLDDSPRVNERRKYRGDIPE